MSSFIIPSTCADTQYEQLSDSDGRVWLMATAAVQVLRARGYKTFQPLVYLTAGVDPDPWLTVTEAAQRVLDEDVIFGASIKAVKVIISRACTNGEIISNGEGRDRRIEPASLNSWLLKRRQEENNDSDE